MKLNNLEAIEMLPIWEPKKKYGETFHEAENSWFGNFNYTPEIKHMGLIWQ